MGESAEVKGPFGEKIDGTVTEKGWDGKPERIVSYGQEYQRDHLTGRYEPTSWSSSSGGSDKGGGSSSSK